MIPKGTIPSPSSKRNPKMKVQIYIYYDTQQDKLCATEYNYWAFLKKDAPQDIYTNEYTQKYLLKSIEFEFECKFDTQVARLQGLQVALAKEKHESAVKQANIQEQIDKLLCLTHDDNAVIPVPEWAPAPVPPSVPSPGPSLDDDIPF
jgi:hypothetical protein